MKTNFLSPHSLPAPSPIEPSVAPSMPKVVRAGQGDCLELPGEGRRPLLEGRDTGGALALARTQIEAGRGAPLHVHTREDEWFLVEEGRFDFRIGGLEVALGPGDFAFGPRGVPHGYAACDGGGALIVGVARAGFERFFRDVAREFGAARASHGRFEPSQMRALAASYGVHIGDCAGAFHGRAEAPKVLRADEGKYLEEACGFVRELLCPESGGLSVSEARTPPLVSSGEQAHQGTGVAYLVRAGRYEFCLGDARVMAGAGDVVWAPRGTPHSLRAVSAGEACVLRVCVGGQAIA